MPDFKKGTREEVRTGRAQFLSAEASNAEGSPAPFTTSGIYTDVGATQKTISGTGYQGIVTDKKVWSGGTRIYHRTVVYPTKDSSGRVTGSKRVVYIEKGERYQPAAVSTDGGQTYVFKDPQFPTMDGVAGAGLQKELNAKDGRIRGHIDHAIVQRVKGDAAFTVSDRSNLVESQRNYEQSLREEPEKPVQPTEPAGGDSKIGETSGGKQAGQEPTPQEILSQNIQSKTGTRDKFPGVSGSDALTYPLSLRDSKQDKIQFNMIAYKPTGVENSDFGTSPRQQQFRSEVEGDKVKPGDIIGRVFLPIPAGITDTTGAAWGDGEMSAIQVALSQVALGGIDAGLTGALNATKETIEKIAGNKEEVKTALRNQIAGEAAGVQGLITRTTGAILNPNLELLFSKPTLRPFNFRFKLSARSQAEANEIIRIIRFFKQGMAPIRSASNLFIKAPHTFKIRYIHDGGDHPFLNQFKECALKNLSVNYTPEGNYATFRDGKMVSYELTMQFQELEPVFNDDYGNAANSYDTNIGF